MTYAVAFMAGFLVDLAYVWWVAAVGRSNPWLAGVASMAVGFFGLCGLTQALDNRLAAAVYLGGLGAGTAVGVLLDRRKQ